MEITILKPHEGKKIIRRRSTKNYGTSYYSFLKSQENLIKKLDNPIIQERKSRDMFTPSEILSDGSRIWTF